MARVRTHAHGMLPPLSYVSRVRPGPSIPLPTLDQEDSNDKDTRTQTYVKTHVAPGAGPDLRDLASQQADRRHTLIQLELAAAHFNTRMVAGRHADQPASPEFSTANAWDEYVTSESHKRATVKKGRRSLKTQLEALSMYMERRSSLRRGNAGLSGPLKDLRTSELHRFEVLRREVSGATRRTSSVGGVHPAHSVYNTHALPTGGLHASMRKRRSVAVALPPLFLKTTADPQPSAAGGRRNSGRGRGQAANGEAASS